MNQERISQVKARLEDICNKGMEACDKAAGWEDIDPIIELAHQAKQAMEELKALGVEQFDSHLQKAGQVINIVQLIQAVRATRH